MSQTLNRITHVNIVTDASWSMKGHATTVVKVVDSHIKHLADRSRQLDQDVHVSVYDFADDVRCLIYDRDVLRLPSIAGLYRPRGNTALIDATLQSLQELEYTAQLHGEHAFLTYVITDGENNINDGRAPLLRVKLKGLPKNWTVACLVPDALGKDDAMAFGFEPDNIAIWNPNGRRGVEEAGTVMEEATDVFLAGRARGVVGTRSLFSMGADAVNSSTVQATLTPLDSSAYEILPVGTDAYIEPFVKATGRQFVRGACYYPLTKRETIQHNKKIAVREKTGARRVFTGPAARDLLGLGGNDMRVRPDHNPDYAIYVQSTSTNRKLIAGTEMLIMK